MYIRRNERTDVPEGYGGCAFPSPEPQKEPDEPISQRQEEITPASAPPNDEAKCECGRHSAVSKERNGDTLILLLAVLLMSGEEIDLEIIVILILLITSDQNKLN